MLLGIKAGNDFHSRAFYGRRVGSYCATQLVAAIINERPPGADGAQVSRLKVGLLAAQLHFTVNHRGSGLRNLRKIMIVAFGLLEECSKGF